MPHLVKINSQTTENAPYKYFPLRRLYETFQLLFNYFPIIHVSHKFGSNRLTDFGFQDFISYFTIIKLLSCQLTYQKWQMIIKSINLVEVIPRIISSLVNMVM